MRTLKVHSNLHKDTFLNAKITSIDYIKTCFSIVLAAISNYQKILRSLFPYLFLLGVFGTFVTVNGGVVLGMSHSL